MSSEHVFRSLFVIFGVAMMAIRIYYQSKVVGERDRTQIKESGPRLVCGAVAAVVTIVFGLEYIVVPGTFGWAYTLGYPVWLRWLGALLLTGGIGLLWLAHHHLDLNFNSLVAAKEGQVLVESGPYRWVRHPVYTAYLMNYVGGGLLSANVVLTFVPVVFFAAMVALRVGDEERVLVETFGDRYEAYMRRTGRFLPRLRQLQSEGEGDPTGEP